MNNQVSTLPTVGKRAKSHAVVHQLRQHIVSKLKPGSQLPTFGEMEQSFGVSRGVLREAVDRLKHDGFIYSIDRRGLYVAERPPHLSRVALVFAQSPACPSWPRFFTALQQEAAGIQQERGDISFASYYNVTLDPRSDSLDELCSDIQAHRLAGVLLMPGCHDLGRIEPIASATTPKLYICGAAPAGRKPSITVDTWQMVARMTRWLRERNRSRIAAVGMWENSTQILRHLEQEGVIARPHWGVTVGRDNASDVDRLVTLLMDYPQGERPDGLMILDDNLTEHALNGLIGCGVRIGQDIDVIAHCNWPWPVPCLGPVQRVGFHARHLLELALRTLEQVQAGDEVVAEQVFIPALFEEESKSPWLGAPSAPITSE